MDTSQRSNHAGNFIAGSALICALLVVMKVSSLILFSQTRPPGPGDEAPPSATGGEPAVIQGGVELTRERLAEIARTGCSENDCGVIDEQDFDPCRDWTIPCSTPDQGDAINPTYFTAPQIEDRSMLTQTPPPTTTWKAMNKSGGAPADAQIAVSTTHVVVTNRAVLAFFNKAGTNLLQMSGGAFFDSLGLTRQRIPITRYFDLRTIFDPFRKRFFVGAIGDNIRTAEMANWRSVIAVGVSKTENPMDGWYLYWWPGYASTELGDVADYPSMGVDFFGLHVTNLVKNKNPNKSISSFYNILLFPGHLLAAGATGFNGWRFWDLKNPDNSNAGHIQPVIHQTPTGRTYYVSRYQSNKLLVWGLTNHLTANQLLSHVEVTLNEWQSPVDAPQLGSSKLIRMTNTGTDPLKAVYRMGRLYVVTNDAAGGFTAVRLVRLSVLSFPNIPMSIDFIDRTFGSGVGLGLFNHAGWPAVGVNRHHDMVVVYARSGQSIYPEIRYNVYLHGDADILPSAILKGGETPYQDAWDGVLPWGDTAGASVDPKDDEAVWIAHQYAANNSYSIWVGKVFGRLLADWSIVKLLPSVRSVRQGDRLRILGEIINQGDGGTRRSALINFYLTSESRGQRYLIASFDQPPLRSGKTAQFTAEGEIPRSVRPGRYNILAVIQSFGEDEYSTENNLSLSEEIVEVLLSGRDL